MILHQSPTRGVGRCRLAMIMFALLSVVCTSCAAPRLVRTGCVDQNAEVLQEIIDHRVASCAPATDLWMREVARDCGWME